MNWAILLLAVSAPISIYAAWSDLKYMRIPNWVSLTAFVVFVIFGIFVLPIGEYGLRIGYGFITLGIGILIHATGLVGGGDIKYLAAIIPFIATRDLLFFVIILSFMSLAGVFTHRLIGKTRLFRQDWKSWSGIRKFPFGFILTGSLLTYLTLNVLSLAY